MSKAVESAPRWGGVVKCALVLALALWVTPAKAQMPCVPVAVAKAKMTETGAITVATMMVDGVRIEIWASPDGARFVMFFVNEEGAACPLVVGTDLHITNLPGGDS